MEDNYRFPDLRSGLTRRISVGGLDVYLTVNAKPSGEAGEIFLKIGKQGSTVSGLMQAWAVTVSAALQRGVPWGELREKYIGTVFEPNDHRSTSLVDAIARNIDDLVRELRERVDEQRGQRKFTFEGTESVSTQ